MARPPGDDVWGEAFLAPDGITIRPIPGARSPLMSVVVGVIPPRDDDYPIHLHHAVEQVTYVLRGRVTVLSRDPEDAGPTERDLQPGQAVTTLPTVTLAFRNRGPEPAEVLFICVPPYPASDADTELVPEHGALDARGRRRAIERQRRARDYLSAVLQARLETLRWPAPAETE